MSNTNTESLHICERCGNEVEELTDVTTLNGSTVHWCDACVDQFAEECERCGDYFESDAMIDVTDRNGNSARWCDSCVSDFAEECEHCGDYYEAGMLHTVDCGDGNYENWCDDCVECRADTCGRCGSLVDEHESTYVIVSDAWSYSNRISEYWCSACTESHTVECGECGDTFADDAISEYYVWGHGYEYLCDHCRDNYYTCCDCGELVHPDDIMEGSDGEWYCPDCIDEHRGSANISGYHHTRAFNFILDDGTKVSSYNLDAEGAKRLYLGVELEVDDLYDRDGFADDVAELYGSDSIELKEDGSLSDDGVEIVTQPMTPAYHLNSGMWDDVTRIVRRYGGTSYDAGTCGLHIHISRSFFKDHDAVYRLDRMFHRFEPQLVRFSRRTDSQLGWCRFSDDSDLAKIDDIVKRKEAWADKKRCAGRYEAVNDTNASTVEVRLWRGTLNMETLRATIELTAGLAIVANSMSDELAETLTWNMLKLLVRFALEQNGLPRNDLDSYLTRRCL